MNRIEKDRARAADRAARVMDAWAGRTEPHTVRTRHGVVRLDKVTHHSDGDGATWVEVWAGGEIEGGDPHFRIHNPPLKAADTSNEDPLGALAEVVALHGGAQVAKRKRRVQG